MALQLDLVLDAAKFNPRAVSEKTKQLNENLIKACTSSPKWYEVGATRYREMRWNGETAFPKALFMHIHGGGWVLQNEASQDVMLDRIANDSQVTVVSVGYRLAPEDPYPAGNEDCFDAAAYLIDHGERKFDAELRFIGGESAGAHLSAVTCLHLLHTRPQWKGPAGLVLSYGCYDLSQFLPAVHHFHTPLMLTKDIMQKYIEAYLPNTTVEQWRDPAISPFYADLRKVKLPDAICPCGTADPLVDDTVLFATKWLMSGAKAVVKIYPGAAHGFTFFSPGALDATDEALKDIATFIQARI